MRANESSLSLSVPVEVAKKTGHRVSAKKWLWWSAHIFFFVKVHEADFASDCTLLFSCGNSL